MGDMATEISIKCEAATGAPDGRRPLSWWHPLRLCSLSQRCSTLAFIAWLLANAAMETPGCWQMATSSALNSGV